MLWAQRRAVRAPLLLLLLVAFHPEGDSKGASAGQSVEQGGRLLDAVGMGKATDVFELLSNGADPNFANEYGETAAHLAAISGSAEILKSVIAAGGNVNAATNARNGVYAGHEKPVRRTPLMWFVNGCQLEAVQMLLDAGADVNYVNEEDQTALDIVSAFDQDDERCAQIKALILEKGALSDKDALILQQTMRVARGKL